MATVEDLRETRTPWLTDAGLETVMIFLEGLELPYFAAFTLLDSEEGRAALTRYFGGFALRAGPTQALSSIR
jgi:homocysteine S-methyltransferase